MNVQTAMPTVDLSTIKGRQQLAWSSGDYAIVGTTLQIVGENLCEAVDLRSNQRVLDVAAGNGNATLAAARATLRPVMSWKTRVVSVRDIAAGTTVGYNGAFVATEPVRLALVAAGYADGLDRRLGNRFSLLVRGQRAPLVGRISMDQAVLDVTEIAGVEAGDEVVILGSQGSETIGAFDHAEAAGTIPWEVFTRIGARVPRVAS